MAIAPVLPLFLALLFSGHAAALRDTEAGNGQRHARASAERVHGSAFDGGLRQIAGGCLVDLSPCPILSLRMVSGWPM